MTRESLEILLDRVAAWPEEDQDRIIRLIDEIEATRRRDVEALFNRYLKKWKSAGQNQRPASLKPSSPKRSPRSAETVARRIIDRAHTLGEFPLIGKGTRRKGTRKLTVADYPYVIVYRIVENADEVQILNVRHTARKQPPAER